MPTTTNTPDLARALGVNLAGADFHGRGGARDDHHTYNSEASYAYFASKGLTLIRLPFLWERLQPVLKGDFDPIHIGAIRRNIEWAGKHGCRVILDVHNYAAYTIDNGPGARSYTIDNVYDGEVKVSTADFIDLWLRLSREFKDEPAVLAYGLVNEPHDMGTADWRTISQSTLAAIRASGDNKLIMVPGDHWSSASQWVEMNGAKSWITDPADNFIYEAHTYFDGDRTGTYQKTYEVELADEPDLPTIGPRRLQPFVDWCRDNGVKGFLGEFGIPDDDPRWLDVLDNFMTALDEAGMPATYWAAGELWGKYPLSVQPTNDFSTDRPQMAVLLKHLPEK
jgi:endoglucanase